MRTVLIENFGRLANQIVAWAKVYTFLEECPDVQFMLGWDELIGFAALPRTILTSLAYARSRRTIPRITALEAKSFAGDCIVTNGFDIQGTEQAANHPSQSIIFDPELTADLNSLNLAACIGVHVRYGDYMRATPGKPRPTFPRATAKYYINAINERLKHDSNARIFLASDGEPNELTWLTDNYPVVARLNSALVDLVALSRCSYIIGSESTFTRLAAAMGDVKFSVPTEDDYYEHSSSELGGNGVILRPSRRLEPHEKNTIRASMQKARMSYAI